MSVMVRIALLRPMARLGPHRWGPRLAEVLVTRSQVVSGLPGSTARRTAAAEEAVTLCRRLAAERPDQRRVALARALVARAPRPTPSPSPRRSASSGRPSGTSRTPTTGRNWWCSPPPAGSSH
nr:hypothetical protein [Micromonospora provocatoris]